MMMRSDRVILFVLLVVCALAARYWVMPGPAKLPKCSYDEIHLRPLGGPLPADLADHVSKFLGKSVVLEAEAPMPKGALDERRGQYDANLLEVTPPKGQFVLEVTGLDIYTSGKPEWRYCFGQRFEGGGVISSAHMGGAPLRLEKMVLRYVLEGAYGCRRVNDSGSLLNAQVLGPGDLDAMEMRL